MVEFIIEELARGLRPILLIITPLTILGIWKAVEIIIWLFQNVSIG